MNIIKQLSGISTRLNELLEDIDRIMDYIDNTELYNEIDNNVKFQLENALTHLDIAIDDINDGMYEDAPDR
jgi:BMFP domain-containing protein YqiC